MVFEDNIELKERQQKLLAEIRKIVGQKYMFSDAYIKKKGGLPRIGYGMMPYGKITKKYVYCSCRAIRCVNEDGTELGVRISKYSLFKNDNCYNVNKIELEDLFVNDLQALRDEIAFSLWWEATVRYLKITAELADCKEYVKRFDKFTPAIDKDKAEELTKLS